MINSRLMSLVENADTIEDFHSIFKELKQTSMIPAYNRTGNSGGNPIQMFLAGYHQALTLLVENEKNNRTLDDRLFRKIAVHYLTINGISN